MQYISSYRRLCLDKRQAPVWTWDQNPCCYLPSPPLISFSLLLLPQQVLSPLLFCVLLLLFYHTSSFFCTNFLFLCSSGLENVGMAAVWSSFLPSEGSQDSLRKPIICLWAVSHHTVRCLQTDTAWRFSSLFQHSHILQKKQIKKGPTHDQCLLKEAGKTFKKKKIKKNAFVVFLCVSSQRQRWSIKQLQHTEAPATGFQRGRSEEPGSGARLVMKEFNCLWALMMSDSRFPGSKWVLLQKCIPNFVASDWINRYKWAAVVYSAQTARY